jgi:hypothetical protein
MNSLLYSDKSDTLTTRNIIDAYRSAHITLYEEAPECEHLEGRWFKVNGVVRDRSWMLLEVERLRQEGIAKAMREKTQNPRGRIFSLIRRLSRI